MVSLWNAVAVLFRCFSMERRNCLMSWFSCICSVFSRLHVVISLIKSRPLKWCLISRSRHSKPNSLHQVNTQYFCVFTILFLCYIQYILSYIYSTRCHIRCTINSIRYAKVRIPSVFYIIQRRYLVIRRVVHIMPSIVLYAVHFSI